MAQDIIIKFKIDGIEQSISSVSSLNTQVVSLKENFTTTSTASASASQSIEENASKISTGLSNAANSGNVLNENLNNVEKGSKNFGGNLVKATKESGKAVLALSNGIQFLGLQGEEVDKVSKAMLILSELMKAQELISEKAFSGKGIKEQLKSLGALILGRKADSAATLANAGAQTANAAATAGAATATRGLTAAMAATPWGVILIIIGTIIAAYELLKTTIEDNTENLQNQIDIFLEYSSTVDKATKNLNDFANIEINNQIAALEGQLALLKSQNGSIQDQYVLQMQIFALKQKQIQQHIEEQKQIATSTTKLDELNGLLQDAYTNEQLLFSKGTAEDYTKAVEKTKNIEGLISAEKQKQVDATKEVKKSQGELNVLVNSTIPAYQATTSELQKQKQLELERFNLAVNRRIEESKKIVSDVEFDINTEKFKNDLQLIQNEIDIFESALSKNNIIFSNQIPFFGGDGVINKLLNDNLQLIKGNLDLELREYIKSEKDKNKTVIDGLGEKIKAAEQSLKYDVLNAEQRKKLEKEITADQSAQAAIRLQTENNIAIKRENLIKKFGEEAKKQGLVSEADLGFLTGNLEQLSTLQEELNNYSLDVYSKSEPKNNLLQSQIDQSKKQLENQNLSADQREKIENRITLYVKRQNEIRLSDEEEINKKREDLFNGLVDSIVTARKNGDQLLNDFFEISKANIKELNNSRDYKLKLIDPNLTPEEQQDAKDKINKTYDALVEEAKSKDGTINLTKFFTKNDVEFNKFGEVITTQLTNSLNSLQTTFENVFSNVENQQNNLDDELSRHGFLRIGFSIREHQAILKESETSGLKLIAEAKKQQDKILLIIKNSNLGDAEIKILTNFINKAFAGFESGVRKKLKKLKDLTKDELTGFINQLVRGIRQATDSIFALFDAINEGKDLQDERRKEALQTEIDQLKEAEDQKLQIVSDSQSKINDLEAQLQTARGNRHAYILSLLATEYRHKQEAEEQAKALQKEQLKREEEKKELQKEQTKRALKLDRTRAIVQGVLGAIETYTSLANIPYVGPILGGIAAAAIVATTAVQVANIDAQIATLAKGGRLKAAGGVVDGPSHEQGGVPGTGKFNNVEVEGGEFVVRKTSTMKNLNILEKLNSDNGNTSFNLVPAYTSNSKMYAEGSRLPDFNTIESAVAVAGQDLTPIVDAIRELNVEVSVVDINKGQNRLTKIKELSRI